MIIRIVAGGPEQELPEFHINNTDETEWIGVDRGALYLLDRGITPSKAFGDFDSVSPSEWKRISDLVSDHVQFPSEKDETDLEIALNYAISQNPDAIELYGVTGGRLDHFFGAVTLLMKEELRGGPSVTIIDRQNRINIYNPGRVVINAEKNIKYYSFFAMNEKVEGLTLQGFKYPLEDYLLKSGSSRCVSNELNDKKGVFSFDSGILMVVRSIDGGMSR
ncbi:thiamine diphosphokinase [Domibacillus epiphyticus]|uniref:Thiamine diphosphokinase n=1 Tax=Domibacillus epiphyticus TaxID=1714355 RepID=A0A1V2AC71_9BACI|nr:thiamine diphosphokinase [Domibacillus epiphyticus]OMP68560.1 thiamine diphosphokinase [Domibacillus epiphyticus]